MHRSIKLATGVSIALISVGCSGGEPSYQGASDEQIDHVLTLIDSGDPVKLTEAIEIGDTLGEESTKRLLARAQMDSEPSLKPQQNWVGQKLPVSWSWWPTGKYPYSATSEYGHCGQDTDIVARYSNVNFSNVSQLYLTTNNGATWLIAAKFGFKLTEWEANNVSKKVSICAGLSILAGLPVFQNQLASMTLNVSN